MIYEATPKPYPSQPVKSGSHLIATLINLQQRRLPTKKARLTLRRASLLVQRLLAAREDCLRRQQLFEQRAVVHHRLA